MIKLIQFLNWIYRKIIPPRRARIIFFTMKRNDCITMQRNLDQFVKKFDREERLGVAVEMALCQSKDYVLVIRLDKLLERSKK